MADGTEENQEEKPKTPKKTETKKEEPKTMSLSSYLGTTSFNARLQFAVGKKYASQSPKTKSDWDTFFKEQKII